MASEGREPFRAAVNWQESGVSPEFCPALRTLVTSAANGFGSLRGKILDRGEHIWEGTKRLPGSTECSVFGGTPPAYVCTLYAGDVEENADGTYRLTQTIPSRRAWPMSSRWLWIPSFR